VGLIYSPGLEPLLQAHPELVDVLEIEPQTTWIETDDDAAPYLVRDDVLEHLAELPGRKLVHSIGTPVGGSVRASDFSDARRRRGFRTTSERLSR
jgi:hypothetical protein